MFSRRRAMTLVKFLLPPSALLLLALSILFGVALAQPSATPVAEIVMISATTQAAPEAMAPGSTADFAVRVLGVPGVEVTAVQLSMTFDTRFLEVVDADSGPSPPVCR